MVSGHCSKRNERGDFNDSYLNPRSPRASEFVSIVVGFTKTEFEKLRYRSTENLLSCSMEAEAFLEVVKPRDESCWARRQSGNQSHIRRRAPKSCVQANSNAAFSNVTPDFTRLSSDDAYLMLPDIATSLSVDKATLVLEYLIMESYWSKKRVAVMVAHRVDSTPKASD